MTEINTTLHQALALQQKRAYSAANALFESILVENPSQPDALHGLALSHAMEKRYQTAIPLFLKAIAAAPHMPAFHNNLANTYKAAGQLSSAQQHYHEALKLKQPYPEAHNNLGNLHLLQGQITEAIHHFQQALQTNPNAIDAHHNLANCYLRVDRLSEAVPHYQAVLAAWPSHVGAHYHLGLTYCALKQFTAAQSHLAYVVTEEPDNVEAQFHLGIIYNSQHALTEAAQCYRQAILHQNHHAKAHHNLATLLLTQQKRQEALSHFQMAYQLDNRNDTAAHMIAALSNQTPASAPSSYIEALFDQYAYNYETHLKDNLAYQLPERLRNLLTPWVQHKREPWHVLDLGCGTGLLAPYLSDFADKLYGVDLSRNMIELARQKGNYFKLYRSEILAFFENTTQQFDMIVSADVFVYFGDLAPVFQAVTKHLAPGGLFCFSIENTPHKDYQLFETGRYGHSEHYIQTLLQADYTIAHHEHLTLRTQAAQDLEGSLYICQKHAS